MTSLAIGSDFCDSFHSNNGSIGFAFRDRYSDKAFVVIGQMFWKLSVDPNQQSIQFVSEYGVTSNGFGEQWIAAFGNGNDVVGLLDVCID